MAKFSLTFLFILLTVMYCCMAGPVEVSKASDDDLNTSETFGYGYYHQPGIYSAPLVANAIPLATTAAIATPVATTTTTLNTASGGYARSGYGYGSGYKYGSGYDYGRRWGYGGGNAVNEFYRRHPVYVAWG